MKKLRSIALGFVLALVSLTGLERAYTHYFRLNVNLKSSYVVKTRIGADMLYLGNCNPASVLCPQIIDSITHLKSYNLAETDADFAENYLALVLYLKNNPAPKYLVFYLAPESFDPNYNRFNPTRYAHFLSEPEVRRTIEDMDPSYYRWTSLPFMRYGYYNEQTHFKAIQGFKHSMHPEIVPYFKDGFEVGMGHQFYYRSYPNRYKFSTSAKRLSYFKRIVSLAKQHQIQIIGFESPFWLEAGQKLPNLESRRKEIKYLLSGYNLTFIDLSSSQGYHKTDFSSTITLTGSKSLAFSQLFADTLLSRFTHQKQYHGHP